LRSGVSAERRHLKTKGKVCGGLPTRRTVNFIQKYDPDLWVKAADDAPFIESIEVFMPGDGDESEKMSNVKPHSLRS
jgi:hypothetical protein